MDQGTLRDFQDILHKQLNEMLPLTAGLRASLDGIQKFRDAMDDVDLISKKSSGEMTSKLLGRTQQLTVEIVGALGRMKLGTFGICAECGDDIGIERLKVQPTTTLCLHCRRSMEQRNQLKMPRKTQGAGLPPMRFVTREANEEMDGAMKKLREVLISP